MATGSSTGYGPRTRLLFDGDERKYELWEAKFYGYLHTLKLKSELEKNPPNADKNADIYAELIQLLDDRSLALIMRDAKDNGKKALEILREHYMGQGKPKIIALYTELTTLNKGTDESTTDYLIRAEAAAAALKNSGETVGDSLLIAMILKGLPSNFNTFKTVTTQKDPQPSFQQFKVSLRAFEESEHSSVKAESVMKVEAPGMSKRSHQITCYFCKKIGHKAYECKQNKRWCIICKSKSHDTKVCRKKGDTVSNFSQEEEPKVNYYFKVGVEPNVEISCNDNVNLLVDCGATTHIVNDLAQFICFDKNFNPDEHYIELADGSRSNNIALKKGMAKVTLQGTNGKAYNIGLENCLYIPSYKQNIFSVHAATEKGASVEFSNNAGSLTTKDGTKFEIKKRGRLYYFKKCEVEQVKQAKHDLENWHKILGHCNIQDILKLPDVVNGMKIVGDKAKEICETCILGKMTEVRSRIPDAKAKFSLELIHCDLAGPIRPVSIDGFQYVLSFTDDFSGQVMTYFVKQKSNTVEATKRFLSDCASFGKIKRLRSDNGTEFTSKEFQALMMENMIRHEKSAPHSPHQNGTAERNWRTLFEMARCLLLEAKLPKDLWTYAVLSATYIRNRCYNRRLEMTPFEAFTGTKPNVKNMNIFGSTCYAYVQDKQKLDSRAKKGIFIGYDKYSPAYFIYFKESRDIKRVRCVTFTNKFDNENDDYDDEMCCSMRKQAAPIDALVEEHRIEEGESNATDMNGNLRYPPRERRQPEYFKDYVIGDDVNETISLNIDITNKDFDSPKTYEEAISSPNARHWKEAMDDEFNSLKENSTFTLTQLPKGKNVIGGRWVYTVKQSGSNEAIYKARYVAKGYSQTKDIDYYETYAPTTKMTSVRALMQLAAQNNYIVHQMDVKTAYLNAPIDCDIYLEQAKGYEVLCENDEPLVYKLNKSLYGLKQSGRNWNNLLSKELIDGGFKQSLTDPCIFVKHDSKDIIILLIWVDDMILVSSSASLLDKEKAALSQKFKMKDLGQISRFLGINFIVRPGKIEMSQKSYLEKVLQKFNMSDCKAKRTPSEAKLNFSANSPSFDARKYREAIGSLIYAMTATRPDISWIVSKLAQYAQNPTEDHWTAVKHVLRYLKGTLDYSLSFTKSEDGLDLMGYCDADWAGSTEDRKSTSGYCFFLNKNSACISWKCRKQSTVALSSCEAEYVAISTALQEAKFLMQLMNEMVNKKVVHCVKLYADNQGAIALAKDPIRKERSKHIDIKYHFIKSEIEMGTITLNFIPTEDNIADIFTKSTSRNNLHM